MEQYPIRIVSPGSFTGEVKKLNLNDKSEPGLGVWIPSLSMDFFPKIVGAKCILSQDGGLCSHLSIILREMNIPAAVFLEKFNPPEKFFVSFYINEASIRCKF